VGKSQRVRVLMGNKADDEGLWSDFRGIVAWEFR